MERWEEGDREPLELRMGSGRCHGVDSQNYSPGHLFRSGFYTDTLEVLCRREKSGGEDKDEVSGCFRDETPRAGW